MSIIIITPPPKKEPTLEVGSQSSDIGTPYTEALRLIEQAELDGAAIRIIET